MWLQYRNGGCSLKWVNAVPVQHRFVSCPQENWVTERLGETPLWLDSIFTLSVLRNSSYSLTHRVSFCVCDIHTITPCMFFKLSWHLKLFQWVLTFIMSSCCLASIQYLGVPEHFICTGWSSWTLQELKATRFSLSLLPCVPNMDLLRHGVLCSLVQKYFGGPATGGTWCGMCVHFESSLIEMSG